MGFFAAILLSLTVYGENTLPNSIFSSGDSICINGLFYADTNSNAVTVSSGGNVQGKFTLMKIIPVKNVTVKTKERRFVAAGGELVGITLTTDGVIIVGTESFESSSGTVSPAKAAGIKSGDILISVDGKKIKNNKEFSQIVEQSKGKELKLVLTRGSTQFETTLLPQKTLTTGTYKAGIWIRDATGGIGTLTYTDTKTQTLASLGHGIYDADTGILLPVLYGKITNATVSGVSKGLKGTAGEILGVPGKNTIGSINSDKGIYGFYSSVIIDKNIFPVAFSNEVSQGKAQIISTVTNGSKQYYDIEIVKINTSAQSEQKSLTLKVTDTALLSITGGIVQGMSGSPIIQNGMLVGAVTHVFINNPQMGYGILAEEMLNQSDALSEALNNAA